MFPFPGRSTSRRGIPTSSPPRPYWAATYDSSNVTTAGGGVFSSTSFLKGGAWGDWNNSTYLGDTPNLSSFSLASGADTPAEANFQFTVDASESVPEPSSYAMLAGGLALLALVLRRRAATPLT
ncbi:MAG: PEP-CTERM sorting domain-containing protein [Verrucomicrobiota bacterium]